jgi:hypothetical protein
MEMEHGFSPRFSVRMLEERKGELLMSASHGSESWLDRWFPLLVIIFGVLFVTLLVSFKPMG